MTSTQRATWWWVVGGCIAARLAIPLAALAAEGTALPGFPAFHYGPPSGDAYGYHAAAREIVAAVSRLVLPLFAVAAFGALLAFGAARRRVSTGLIVGLVAVLVSLATTLVVLEMKPAGAPVIGWPLLWALGLLPLRLLQPGLGPDAAFAVGFLLSLLAIAATVVAVAFAGFWSSGERRVGLVAAALFALWPFVPGLVVGERAWENGTWFVDVGLHLYTEPLSTALVVGAVALLLRPAAGDLTMLAIGLALGFATVVKLSDGVIAVGLIGVLLVARRWRQALLVSLGGFVALPVLIAYWGKGYVATYGGSISASDRPWSLQYVEAAWGDSLLFSPLLIALLVVPAVVGTIALRTMFDRAIVVVPVVVTVITYSVYYVTALHPRFLYVALPLVLVLDSAGVVGVIGRARGRQRHSSTPRVT